MNGDRLVVVITGASAGIGRAAAREFGKLGASVGLIARGRDGLEGARREIESVGGRALVLPVDVSDFSAVADAAERVERELGPIDVWVNDAMLSVFSPVLEMRPEEYRRVTEVTYLGYVHGTLAALRYMVPRNRGKIVQVGSALAYRAIPLQSAYCAAKHAVKGFTESLRAELLHDGRAIDLTMVNMPAVNTPQFGWVRTRLPGSPQPVPPIYQPEVAARAIVWAAFHERRDLDVGYMTTVSWLGEVLAPGFTDRYLARTGYSSQQTDQPVDPNRRDNLWEPVPGDHGAHGTFDDRAHEHSPHLWAETHRGLIVLGGLLLGAGIWGLARAARRGIERGAEDRPVPPRPVELSAPTTT